MRYFIKINILVISFIFVSMFYLYTSINDAKSHLTKHLNNILINQAKEYGKNINAEITTVIKNNLYSELKEQPHLRKKLEYYMSAQITQYYKYIYILYRDKEGDYRYLLDGSKVDKGLFDRKLTVNKQLWDTVYTSKKEYVSVQNNLDNLWMTYLKPIIIKNRVNAILSIDFSSNLSEGIENSIKPLYQTILYLFISFLIIIFILIIQAILSLKNKKESITDTLTQAKNRNYLKKLSNTIKIKNYQIMLLDIDFFKKINDTYGHQAGDFILNELSKIIKNMIRDHDEFIRYGGEEFLLMIYNRNKNKTVAREIAERLRQRIQDHTFKYENIDIKITISIGISCFPENFKNLYEAIKYADRMLYLAKEKGRNIVIYKS